MVEESPRLARRMGRIRPFYVMDLLARARALEATGRDIVHMEIGEPDFDTPAPIIEAAHRALVAGRTRYTPALGLPELRRAIALHYETLFGLKIAAERVVVTPGSSGALQLVMGVLIEAGDEVLLADPGYPCNRHFVELMGGRPVGIPVGCETHYQLTTELIDAAWGEHTRLVLLASPSNPTGTLVSPKELARIHKLVRARGGILVVDEIYQRLVYGQAPRTALASGDDLFVVNSFSKYYGMTGWRLGWIVAPEPYVPALDRLAQNIFLAAPTLSQYAAMEAFSPVVLDILERRREEFAARRDYLLPALGGLGFRIAVEPQGAFYLYADCAALADDSAALCDELLEHAGVAITPGMDFGHHRPEAHVRFAYTTNISRLEEGVARIGRFLRAGAG